MLRLKVPGNLLLAGEYLVLEEGGPGLCLALEPYVLLGASPAREWSVKACLGGHMVDSQPGAGYLPLVDSVFALAPEYLAKCQLEMPAPCALTLDSDAFFGSDGRKLGFGSSAATVVALAQFLVTMAEGRQGGMHGLEAGTARSAASALTDPDSMLPLALLLALDSHRRLQGGRGSGYDVFTSFYGGFGLFRGGRYPRWYGLNAAVLPEMAVFSGQASVSSGPAVQRYHELRTGGDSGLLAAVARMRQAVEAYAAGQADFVATLYQARQAGLDLGDILGIDARMHGDIDNEDCFCKALGAGNELGLLVGFSSQGAAPLRASLRHSPLPLRVSDGPVWLQ